MSPTYSICREHGYLSGEQKRCPKCGSVTEIYSRITGYYRPVQNWNDGKLQEYGNRTEYKMGNMVYAAHEKAAKGVAASQTAAKKAAVRETVAAGRAGAQNVGKRSDRSKTMLFTTKTCPNCRLAKEYLKDVDYTIVDAEDNYDLAVQYGVMQAPTLVIVSGQSQQKYVNASNIRRYAEFLQTRI